MRTEKDRKRKIDTVRIILSETGKKGDLLMGEKAKKIKVIKGCLTEEKYNDIQKYSEESGISISSLVIVAVLEYMKRHGNTGAIK